MYIGRLNFNSNTVGTAISLSAGGVFIGVLSTSRTTFLDNEAVTKLYVDTTAASATLPNATLYLSKDGGLPMTGPLVMPGTATANNHAVNKTLADSYITTNVSNAVVTVNQTTVDSLVNATLPASDKAIKPGEIVRYPSTTAPSGFLRCNGAVVLKSTYGALYTVIGDQYNVATQIVGNGQPWRLQSTFNTTDNGNITGWVQGTSLPVTLMKSQVLVTKNRIYLIGGSNSAGTMQSSVYTAAIDSNGIIQAWSASTSLPVAMMYHLIIVTTNRVYILAAIGSNSVYTCLINSDGTLGTWVLGTALPVVIQYSQAVITTNKVYLLGGQSNGTSLGEIYTCTINTDGTLGTWSLYGNLPITPAFHQAIVTSSRVYILSNASSEVYYSVINGDGTLSSWVRGTDLPTYHYISASVVTSNRVYLLSGQTSGWTANVYHCPINSDGSLGTWVLGTALPEVYGNASVAITSSRIYLLAGIDIPNNINKVYYAPFYGGTNDYTTSLFTTLPSTPNFTLPNLTAQDAATTGVYSYIKT